MTDVGLDDSVEAGVALAVVLVERARRATGVVMSPDDAAVWYAADRARREAATAG